MAPEASAGKFLNYVFLLVGMALISVLLQSLVRFEAIRVQTVWAVSVQLSDHDEDHVSRTADEIWGKVGDDATKKVTVNAREFKRKVSRHADEGGLSLSLGHSPRSSNLPRT